MGFSPDHQLVASILAMYREGWFPMADPDRAVVEWVQPHVRGLIPLTDHGLRISRSLRQRCRNAGFVIRADTAFDAVIRACARPRPGREKTWIDASIIHAYNALHRAGHAHSVEAWLARDGRDTLVGGLYGVHLGSAFFGESMFSRPELGGTDASKVCLVHLWHHLRARGFTLLDAQLHNDHLARLGCVEIPREKFLPILHAAAARDASWSPWSTP